MPALGRSRPALRGGPTRRSLLYHWGRRSRHTATGMGLTAGTHAEAGLFCEFDQPLRLANGFGSDRFNADLVDDLVTRPRGIERGNVRSAVQKSEGIGGVVDGAGFEFERMAMGGPTCRRGMELGARSRAARTNIRRRVLRRAI